MNQKRFSSVVTIAFSVEHDDPNDPTADELKVGLRQRCNNLLRESDEILEAVGGELFDTQELEIKL